MSLRFYPACVKGAREGGLGVFFPDLPGCRSAGTTVQEAAINAAEALALHVEGLLADGRALPNPSPPDAPLPKWSDEKPGEIVALILVPVDVVPVDRPGKRVRASITIEEGLLSRVDAAAAAEGTTRSGFLAQAARERLQRGGG